MPDCPECGGPVEATFHYCPWCSAPQRRKLVQFFHPHEELESDHAAAAPVPAEHRRQLMLVLHALANGEQDDVAEECQETIRSGAWLLYEEISSGRNIDAASYAYELLELIEGESNRLEDFHAAVRQNLPSDLQ